MCPAGTYSDSTSITSVEQCKPCDAGKFNALTGQSSCTICEKGKYNTLTGRTLASECLTYANALANTNPWSYCNYDDIGIGFPRDCGPTSSSGNEWQSATRDGQTHWSWYADQNSMDKFQQRENAVVEINSLCGC